MENRARDSGEAFERAYWEEYSLLSQYIHPGGAGIDRISPRGFKALFGIAHEDGQKWFLHGTQRICDGARIFDGNPSLRAALRSFREKLPS